MLTLLSLDMVIIKVYFLNYLETRKLYFRIFEHLKILLNYARCELFLLKKCVYFYRI